MTPNLGQVAGAWPQAHALTFCTSLVRQLELAILVVVENHHTYRARVRNQEVNCGRKMRGKHEDEGEDRAGDQDE